MEFVFWYAVIGLVVCGISTVYTHIKLKEFGIPTEFRPSGLLVSMTIWPFILLALIVKLILIPFKH